ncbi:prim-pol domain-containing protein [Rhizoclosmatium globosum]|uniref:DNA primase n=1 Tax=Rhizoclosmatium globosum TaxID=329046 RepID=A0A1Y2CYD3_9FUNG|nr:prim-pol domain-containing protein [Rhizoclosmatium globosum]|eukprot:ORY52018.1 prim-pol domain-containing protein [Rhizoclosmatium globosum]
MADTLDTMFDDAEAPLSQPCSPAQSPSKDRAGLVTAVNADVDGDEAMAEVDDEDEDNDEEDEAALSPVSRRQKMLSTTTTTTNNGNDLGIDFDKEDEPMPQQHQQQQQQQHTSDSQPELSLALAADADFSTLLSIFYRRLFPFREFYRWLAYGNVQKNYFVFRELSFTLANDAYLRFQSFKDGDELKDKICDLMPVKIDIGAVYNAKPKDKKILRPGSFNPMERELVFDIDMTDYDPIRSCCSGAEICLKCWDFMTVSIKILDRALQDDFGFKHRLWIYSGRRGVHCWVCDDRARKLTAEARRAIVNYLEVVKGGEETSKKVSLNAKALHPSLRKANEVLDPMFTKRLIHTQDILSNPEKWKRILALIPDEELRKKFDDQWAANKKLTPHDKWLQVVTELKTLSKKKPAVASTALEILFQYSYPRLDSNVSIGLNHLLKAPFCVHPKTGRVCIPIDAKKCDTFDPFQAPKLSDIVNQIAEYDLSNKDKTIKVPDYAKTSLKSHVEYFRTFVEGLEEEAKVILRARRAEEDKKLQF